MHKIMVITTCDECKDVWLYLGVDGYCKRKNYIAIPEEKIYWKKNIRWYLKDKS
jgi:translation initiation factor 2 alpha subunit (eIF-2alpha)